jgi:hypothetical protein
MTSHPPVGHFGHQSVVGTYQPSLTTLDTRKLRDGLGVQVCYVYGGGQDSDSTLHAFERKFIGPMTAGLWLMRLENGKVKIDPSSARTVRGETKRTFGDDEVVWTGQMMETQVGEHGREEGFVLRFTNGAITWTEGDILRLHGALVGPGLQVLAPDPIESFYYSSQLYKVSGRVVDADVEGFVFLDHGAWPHGTDWKEFLAFNHLQLAWAAFANEYEDGTIEWGYLCIGADRFSFMMVADAHNAVTLRTTDVTGGVDLGENQYVQRAVWRGGDGRTWRFDLEPGGQLAEFAEARWGGYRAHAGLVRRVDDERTLKAASPGSKRSPTAWQTTRSLLSTRR